MDLVNSPLARTSEHPLGFTCLFRARGSCYSGITCVSVSISCVRTLLLFQYEGKGEGGNIPGVTLSGH